MLCRKSFKDIRLLCNIWQTTAKSYSVPTRVLKPTCWHNLQHVNNLQRVTNLQPVTNSFYSTAVPPKNYEIIRTFCKKPTFIDCFLPDDVKDNKEKPKKKPEKTKPAQPEPSFLECFMTDNVEDKCENGKGSNKNNNDKDIKTSEKKPTNQLPNAAVKLEQSEKKGSGELCKEPSCVECFMTYHADEQPFPKSPKSGEQQKVEGTKNPSQINLESVKESPKSGEQQKVEGTKNAPQIILESVKESPKSGEQQKVEGTKNAPQINPESGKESPKSGEQQKVEGTKNAPQKNLDSGKESPKSGEQQKVEGTKNAPQINLDSGKESPKSGEQQKVEGTKNAPQKNLDSGKESPKSGEQQKVEGTKNAPQINLESGKESKETQTQHKEQPAKKRERNAGINVKIKQPYKLHHLQEAPSGEVNINKEEAQLYYKQMQTIRRMEAAADALYKDKTIRGFCHLYSGQEACAVGIKAAMRDQDNIITAYRCHGWSYMMNIPPIAILAELMGRKSGCSRGKGGSMHMFAPHFFGGNGIVGAQVPLGTGVALSCKYKADQGVCFALYGDGAANQGQVFESYNMAYLWKLPCIFVCENNNYGMGTAASRASSNTNYYVRGDVLPGIWVDGMDVLAVRNATEYAIDYAMKNGPMVMETNTYRYSGHSMSDPGVSYRSREEVQEVRQNRDPITNFKNLCVQQGLLTEEETKAVDENVRKEIDEAVEKAKSDTEIELNELTADINSNNLEPNIRGILGYTLTHTQINKGGNNKS